MKVSQGQVIMKAIEIAAAAGSPTAMSMEKMLDGLRSSRSKQGDSGWREQWASDFLACLPADPVAQRLLLLSYLPVYVCHCGVMHFDQGRCDDCNEFAEVYQWQPGEKQRLGGIAKSFWNRIQAKRLFATGFKLVDCV